MLEAILFNLLNLIGLYSEAIMVLLFKIFGQI
jgi:hypothetical protein